MGIMDAVNAGASSATCNMLAVGAGVAATSAVGNVLTLNAWGAVGSAGAALALGALHSGLGCSSPLNFDEPPANVRDRVPRCAAGLNTVGFIVYNGDGSPACTGGSSYTTPAWESWPPDPKVAEYLNYEPVPNSNRCDGVYFKSDKCYYVVTNQDCRDGNLPEPLPPDPTSYDYTYVDIETNTEIDFKFVGAHIDANFVLRPTFQATFAPELSLGPVNVTVGFGGSGGFTNPPPPGEPIPGPDYPVLPPPAERCYCDGEPGNVDLGPLEQAVAELSADVAAIQALLIVPSPSGEWRLSSPCVTGNDGGRVETVIALPPAGDRLTAIMGRLDGLADVAQAGKDLKQPICGQIKPVGEEVTVQFEEM